MGVAAAAVPAQRSDPAGLEEARHLRVVPLPVRTAARRRRRARALALLAVSLVMTVAFGLVYLHVVLAQRQFALDRLTSKVQAEQATYQNLRLQAAQSGSPQQIISTAEGQLGMRQPPAVSYLTPTVTIGGASSPDSGSAAASGSSGPAPAGDADWPQIKAQLAGSP
jgi:cell division protein FtsL